LGRPEQASQEFETAQAIIDELRGTIPDALSNEFSQGVARYFYG